MDRQQGDVVVRRIASLPEGAKRVASRPVMVGEGHHEHVLERPEAAEMYERDGVLYLRLTEAQPLRHRTIGGGAGEHGAIVLEPGIYECGPVQEWDPWSNEARQVVD